MAQPDRLDVLGPDCGEASDDRTRAGGYPGGFLESAAVKPPGGQGGLGIMNAPAVIGASTPVY